MLEMKVATEMEIPKIQKLLEENQIAFNFLDDILPNNMIAYDGENPVAAAGFSDYGEEAVIQYVVVAKRKQGEYLGDGILKALLNYADRKGIKWVYVNGTDIKDFLSRVGFEEISYDNLLKIGSAFVTNQFSKKSIIFTAGLPDFFFRACRSNKS